MAYIYVNKIIKKCELKYNCVLDKKYKKKLSYSYAVVVPSIVAYIYGSNLQNKISFNTRYLLFLSFIASIFDDFIDNKTLNEDEITALLHNPESFVVRTLEEDIFKTYYIELLQKIGNKTAFKNALLQINHWQIQSAQQMQANITNEQLQTITFGKGGNSFLLFVHFFDAKLSPSMAEIYFKFGALFQMVNDIFDMHKDWQQGIKTLPNSASNIQDFYQFYRNQVFELKAMIEKSTEIGSKKVFLAAVLSVVCLPMVALEQIEKLQLLLSNWYHWQSHDRSFYICDMALWHNKWRYWQLWKKYLQQ